MLTVRLHLISNGCNFALALPCDGLSDKDRPHVDGFGTRLMQIPKQVGRWRLWDKRGYGVIRDNGLRGVGL